MKKLTKITLPQKAGSDGSAMGCFVTMLSPLQNSREIKQVNSICPMARIEGLEPAVLMRSVGGAALLLLPLLLMSSQFLFYGKREEEYAILYAIGKTPRERRTVFAAEVCLFCVTVVLAAALACPVGYGMVLTVTDMLGLPLPAGVFSPLLYGGILGAAALSSALVGILARTRLRSFIQDRRSRS